MAKEPAGVGVEVEELVEAWVGVIGLSVNSLTAKGGNGSMFSCGGAVKELAVAVAIPIVSEAEVSTSFNGCWSWCAFVIPWSSTTSLSLSKIFEEKKNGGQVFQNKKQDENEEEEGLFKYWNGRGHRGFSGKIGLFGGSSSSRKNVGLRIVSISTNVSASGEQLLFFLLLSNLFSFGVICL